MKKSNKVRAANVRLAVLSGMFDSNEGLLVKRLSHMDIDIDMLVNGVPVDASIKKGREEGVIEFITEIQEKYLDNPSITQITSVYVDVDNSSNHVCVEFDYKYTCDGEEKTSSNVYCFSLDDERTNELFDIEII